jgi:hypothetical protein
MLRRWFLLSLLSGCALLQVKIDTNQPDLETVLRQQWPQLTHFSTETWPVGSDRYSGLLKRVQLKLPATAPENTLRERLRELLAHYLQTHEHPEADCVAIQLQAVAQQWQLTAEIVCR